MVCQKIIGHEIDLIKKNGIAELTANFFIAIIEIIETTTHCRKKFRKRSKYGKQKNSLNRDHPPALAISTPPAWEFIYLEKRPKI